MAGTRESVDWGLNDRPVGTSEGVDWGLNDLPVGADPQPTPSIPQDSTPPALGAGPFPSSLNPDPGVAGLFAQQEVPSPSLMSSGAAGVPAPSEMDPYAGEGMISLLKRRGQEVTQGFGSVISDMFRGADLNSVIAETTRANEAARVRDTQRADRIMDLETTLANPDLKPEERAFFEGQLADLKIGQQELTRRAEAEIVPYNQRPGQERAATIDKWVDDTFGVPPQDDSFWSLVAQGGGSMGAFVLPALLGPAGLIGTAKMGADVSSVEAYERAVNAGATEEQAQQAAKFANILGMSEAAPIASALRYLPGPLKSKVTGRFGRWATETLANAGEEALQEGLAAIGQNLIALGYDPETEIFTKDVLEQALVGAILGGALGGTTAALDLRKQPPVVTPQEPDAPAPLALPAPPPGLPAPEGTPPASIAPRQVTGPDQPPQLPAPPPALPAPQMPQAPVVDEATATAGPGVPDEPPQAETQPQPSPEEAPEAPAREEVRLTRARREEIQAVFPSDFAPLINEQTGNIEATPEEAQGLVQAIRQTYDPENGIDTTAARRNSMLQLAAALENQYRPTQPVQQPVVETPPVPAVETPTTEDVPNVASDEVDNLIAQGQDLEAIRDFYSQIKEGPSQAIAAEANRRLMGTGTSENTGTTVPTETGPISDDWAQQAVNPSELQVTVSEPTFAGTRTVTVTTQLPNGQTISFPYTDEFKGGLAAARKAVGAGAAGMSRDEFLSGVPEYDAARQPKLDELGNPVPKAGKLVGMTATQAKEQAKRKKEAEEQKARATLDQAQAELDDLLREIRDDGFTPSTPKEAKDQHQAAMSRIRSKIASLKNQYNLADEDRLTVRYTLRRPSGDTKYRKETGADGVGFEEWVSETLKPMRLNLGNVKGTEGRPVRNQPRSKVTPTNKFSDAGNMDRRDRVGRKPPGRLSPSFMRFSITNRVSVFRSALTDAGIPDNAPMDRQINGIKAMIKDKYGITVRLPTYKVRRKNRFGRKVVEERTTLTERETLDQLLNAYQNLELLAASMGVPASALGLEINGKGIVLDLVGTRRLRGALGMFSWNPRTGERVITIPGRSNSFAHEWGHALDHYLNTTLERPRLWGMLTRGMDKNGMVPPLSPKRRVTDAFARMMWSMFGDMSKINAMTLDMQVTSAEIGPDGKPTAAAKEAQKFLNHMKSGKRIPAKYWNNYFKNAQEFGDAVGDGGYFADPAEMFARAFEAWVARKVGQMTDDPQSFLTKDNWAYNDDVDDRLRMTFPKDADADQFDIAMSDVALAMAQTRALGPGEAAKARPDTNKIDPVALLEMPKNESVLAREKAGAKRLVRDVKANLRATTWLTRTTDFAKGLRSIYQTMFNTTGAALWAVSMRQKTPAAKAAVRAIATKIAKLRPGSGDFTDHVWQERVEMKAKGWVSKIDNALRRHMKMTELTESDMRALRDTLNGSRTEGNDNVSKAAREIRQVLNEIWYDLRDGKINVGYARNYLPHIYSAEKAGKNQEGFKKAAKEVYSLLFTREVREADAEGQLADLLTIINELQGATKGDTAGERVGRNILKSDDLELINQWNELRREMKDLRKRLKKAKTEKGKAKINAAIAELKPELDAAQGEVMDMVEDRYSSYAADNWYNRMAVGQLNDHSSIGPSANFLKGRTLPNEAGHIMREFMDDDVVGTVMHYAFTAARRAEYGKVFGATDSDPDPNAKLKNMLAAAADEGVSPEDIAMIKLAVNAATGRFEASTHAFSKLRSYTFTYGTMALLPLAAFTSLSESTVGALRTGRMRDGLWAVAENLRGLVQSGRRQDLRELAGAIGLVAPFSVETLMENRLSADAITDMPAGAAKALQKYFIMNGLSPLTQFQRVMQIPIASHFVLRMLRDNVRGRSGIGNRLRDVTSGKGKGGFADNELNELGIPPEVREDLLTWMETFENGFPGMRDLFMPDGSMHPAGEVYAAAVTRFVNETIQNPLKTDRPIQANHPDYAALYGIMSFIDGFTRNIIQRNILRGVKDDDGFAKKAGKATLNTALSIMPFSVLMAGHMLTTMLREFLLNGDKWEELDDEDELFEWLVERALWRTGFAGRVDPIAQMITGIKYDRDLTTVTAGPYLGHLLQNVQRITNAFVGRNSPNTNTTEWNAHQAFYQLAVEPMLLAGLSNWGPAGPITIGLSRYLMFEAGSYDASKEWATMMAGEKGEEHRGTPKWYEEFGD